MKLTEEQIASILTKETKAKTILVDTNDVNKSIEEHKKDGWILFSQVKINEKSKLTFRK